MGHGDESCGRSRLQEAWLSPDGIYHHSQRIGGSGQTFRHAFLFGADSPEFATGLVEVLTKLKNEGKINNKVAVLSVADQFGADLNAAAAVAFKKGGFETLVNKSYPVASRDLSSEIKQAMESGADTFAGFSYPGDTFMIAGQAHTLGYNPKVFYTAVGTAFPGYVGALARRLRVCSVRADGIAQRQVPRTISRPSRSLPVMSRIAGAAPRHLPACRPRTGD